MAASRAPSSLVTASFLEQDGRLALVRLSWQAIGTRGTAAGRTTAGRSAVGTTPGGDGAGGVLCAS